MKKSISTQPAKASAKAAAKPAPKPVSKPVAEAVAKPVSKPAAKAAAAVKSRAMKKPVVSAPETDVAPQPVGKASVAIPVKTAVEREIKSSAPARSNGAGADRAALDGKERPRKAKLVRDSFTMPEAEYAVLGEVKKACLKAGYEVKKSELLRVGVSLIRAMDIVALKDVLAALPPVKAGRPKKV